MESKLPHTQINKLNHLAWILDSSIKIPGSKRTIGIDGLIGLVPGIGDISGGLISSYIVMQAVKMGVSKVVIGRMLLNVLLESTIGVIPIVGDIFDFMFKSNQRNVALINEFTASPAKTRQRSGLQILGAVIMGLAFIMLLIYLVIKVIAAIFSLI